MTSRKNADDQAKLARAKIVSTLPNSHQPTQYARATVCARCGQDWPCESVQGITAVGA